VLVTATQVQTSIRGARTGLRVIKASAERRYVLGKAYGPGALDAHNEFMTADTVENAAWGYLADGGRQIGLHHADGTVGHAQVVESYVYRGPDWTITDAQGGTQTVRAGDWLIGAIFDPAAWRLVRAGRLVGWSVDGIGRRVKRPRSEAPITTPGEGE
jgi:hypothetical protein